MVELTLIIVAEEAVITLSVCEVFKENAIAFPPSQSNKSDRLPQIHTQSQLQSTTKSSSNVL